MSLFKLPYLPEKTSYVYSDSSGVVSSQLDSGVSRSRNDQIGQSSIVNCTWELDNAKYELFMVFYNKLVGKGALWFNTDLVLDKPEIEEFECKFVPDSLSSERPSALAYTVSAQLEVKPKAEDNSELFIQMLNFDSFVGQAFNADDSEFYEITDAAHPKDNWCICCWVLSGGPQRHASECVLEYRDGGAGELIRIYRATNKYQVVIGTGGANSVSTELWLPENKLYHFVFQVIGSEYFLYINGVETNNAAMGALPADTATWKVAKFSNSGYFNGIIGDVRHYKNGLTEANRLWFTSFGEEGSKPNANDLLGSWLQEVIPLPKRYLYRNEIAAYKETLVGKDFDSASSDYVYLGGDDRIDPRTENWALSFWFKADNSAIANSDTLFEFREPVTGAYFRASYLSGYIDVISPGVGSTSDADWVNDGEWENLIFVASFTRSTFELYREGQLVYSNSLSAVASAALTDEAFWVVGRLHTSAINTNYYTEGEIATFEFFRQDLTTDEAYAISAGGVFEGRPDDVVLTRFDGTPKGFGRENLILRGVDEGANAAETPVEVTNTGVVTNVDGRFDRTANTQNLLVGRQVLFRTYQEFSLGGWFIRTAANVNDYILIRTDYGIAFTNVGAKVYRRDSGGVITTVSLTDSDLTTLSTLFHFAVTSDGTDTKFYINGVLVSTQAHAVTIDDTDDDISIFSTWTYRGEVSDLRFEVGRIWSLTEIAAWEAGGEDFDSLA